jgi:hypothetical protein
MGRRIIIWRVEGTEQYTWREPGLCPPTSCRTDESRSTHDVSTLLNINRIKGACCHTCSQNVRIPHLLDCDRWSTKRRWRAVLRWREQAEYLSAFGGEPAVSPSLENVTRQKPANDCSGVCHTQKQWLYCYKWSSAQRVYCHKWSSAQCLYRHKWSSQGMKKV